MPITSSGQKVLRKMKKKYGATKGERVFHATINKGKKGSSKWHGAKKKKRKASVRKRRTTKKRTKKG